MAKLRLMALFTLHHGEERWGDGVFMSELIHEKSLGGFNVTDDLFEKLDKMTIQHLFFYFLN